jgi:hypothetical protein
LLEEWFRRAGIAEHRFQFVAARSPVHYRFKARQRVIEIKQPE